MSFCKCRMWSNQNCLSFHAWKQICVPCLSCPKDLPAWRALCCRFQVLHSTAWMYDVAAFFFSGKRHQCSQVGSSMAQRVMLKWSQARQKDIQEACNDTASWTALDEIIYQHAYSFSSIAAWPVDGCFVCKPTERASVLLGSLQAACNLDVIKEDLGVSVTVVVSMCETEMQSHGAPSNWKDYFSERDVVHIHCQLDDITLKQPGRDLERHEALQRKCLSSWKSICLQLWQQSIIAVHEDKPMHILFHCFGRINRSAAILCAWLIVAYDYSAEDAIKLLLTKRPSLRPWRHREYVLDALWMVEQQRSEWCRDLEHGAA